MAHNSWADIIRQSYPANERSAVLLFMDFWGDKYNSVFDLMKDYESAKADSEGYGIEHS